jgi:ADP-heptose:LPS heptosyltransferase
MTATESVDLGCAKRIAVVRALQLGDLLTAVPAMRALRAGFPQAEITLIGLPWAAEFCARFSHYLDGFLTFPGYPGIQEARYEPQRTERFFEAQRARPFDLAIQMHGSGRTSNAFTASLGARLTAGLYIGERPSILRLAEPYPEHLPEVLRNLRLTRLVGAPNRGTGLEFPLFPADRDQADGLLSASQGPLIGIHPGARDPRRRWEIERFAEVADAFAGPVDADIVLTGSAAEAGIVEALAGTMRYPARNLAGRSSLGGLAAIIDRLDLLITNDSGPAHLADALGTPSITIFGPADPRRWASLDQLCHPFVRRPVEPAVVVDLAMQLLERSTPASPAPAGVTPGARSWR